MMNDITELPRDGYPTAVKGKVDIGHPIFSLLDPSITRRLQEKMRGVREAGDSGHIPKGSIMVIEVQGMQIFFMLDIPEEVASKPFGSPRRTYLPELPAPNYYSLEPEPSTLTKREKEVLALMVDEYTSLEIGEKLFISPRTVAYHRQNLLQKIGAKNSIGLIKYALKHGIVS